MINSWRFAIKQAFLQAGRNKNMSFASVFSITAMLLLLGIFFVITVNIGMVTEQAKDEYDTIEAFFFDEVTEDEAYDIVYNIQSLRGVMTAEYLSKEDALTEWKVEWGENGHLLDSLTENPLPNSVIVTVESLDSADAVAETLGGLQEIEKVNYYKETVDTLVAITDAIQISAMVIMVFLVIISIVVVSNTIKLTVIARAKEIHIMKYVGATNWFIRGPFFIEGVLIGLFSAIIAVLAVTGIYMKVIDLIGTDIMIILETPMVSPEFLSARLMWIFMAIGVSIGACGSIISMRRFLDT